METQTKLTLDDFQIESFTTSEEEALKGGTAWLCVAAGVAILADMAHDAWHMYSGSTHTQK